MPITGIGVTNHGELEGLSDDDHNQYVIGDASRASDKLSITQTTTSGNSLVITRNLASGSTDSPMCSITNVNASDDQNSLEILHAGNGRAMNVVKTKDDNNAVVSFSDDSQGANGQYVQFCRGDDTQRRTAYFERNLASSVTGKEMCAFRNRNVGDDQHTVYVEQVGTGSGIFVEKTSNSGISYGAKFSETAGGADTNYAGFALGDVASRRTAYIYRNHGSASTGSPVAEIVNANSGDDQMCLNIQQNSTGQGIWIKKNTDSSNAVALFYDESAGANTNLVLFGTGGNSFRRTAYIYRNLGSANTGDVVCNIIQDHSGDDQNLLNLQQDGSGFAQTITKNGAGGAIQCLKTSDDASGWSGYFGENSQGGDTNYAAFGRGANTNRESAYIYRNLASGVTGAPVAQIINDNAGDDQPTLLVQNDGTDGAIKMVGVTSDPASPTAGAMWFRSDTEQFMGYNGTSTVILG